MNINEKAKELKVKALCKIEKRVNDETISVRELKECVDCINSIEKDEAFLQNYLVHGGFGFGGFNGVGSKPTDESPIITCDGTEEKKS